MSTESWVITAPQAVDVADVRRVVVQLTDGSVDVVADPGRESGGHLDVSEVSERPLQVSVHDGELRVGYDFAGIEGVVERAKGLRDKDRAVVRQSQPGVPAGVQHQPRHEAVPGLPGQRPVTRREVAEPLVVRGEGREGVDERHAPPGRDVGERG